MKFPTLQLPTDSWSSARVRELALEQRDQQYRRTDQLFARLLAVEFIAGVAAAALWISPYAWSRSQWDVHIHPHHPAAKIVEVVIQGHCHPNQSHDDPTLVVVKVDANPSR